MSKNTAEDVFGALGALLEGALLLFEKGEENKGLELVYQAANILKEETE